MRMRNPSKPKNWSLRRPCYVGMGKNVGMHAGIGKDVGMAVPKSEKLGQYICSKHGMQQ